MEWIKCSDRLPENQQKILILYRRAESSVWKSVMTYYLPFLKNGLKKKYPFGNTFEVYAWYPIPEVPEVKSW